MEKWLNRPGSYNCIYALPADTLGRDVIACLGHKPQQGRRLALAGPRHAGNSPAPTRNQGTTVIRPLARQPDQGGSQRESDRHLGRAQPPSADGGQVAPSEARQCHVRPASRCDSAIPTAPGIAAATKTCSGWYVSTCPGGPICRATAGSSSISSSTRSTGGRAKHWAYDLHWRYTESLCPIARNLQP